MRVIRVIPCLDVDRGRVVKGTIFVDHLRGLQKSLILRKIRKLGQSGKW